jgi:hypothetical protein
MRRTSSDSGRAPDRFVGGAAPTDDWNKLEHPWAAGHQTTPAPLSQQQRRFTLEASSRSSSFSSA